MKKNIIFLEYHITEHAIAKIASIMDNLPEYQLTLYCDTINTPHDFPVFEISDIMSKNIDNDEIIIVLNKFIYNDIVQNLLCPYHSTPCKIIYLHTDDSEITDIDGITKYTTINNESIDIANMIKEL